MNVVLDTNVLVSALLKRLAANAIDRSVLADQFPILTPAAFVAQFLT